MITKAIFWVLGRILLGTFMLTVGVIAFSFYQCGILSLLFLWNTPIAWYMGACYVMQ